MALTRRKGLTCHVSLKRKSRLKARSPKKQQERDADFAWQQAVITRDGGRCQRCGEHSRVVGHHVIYRRFRATRHMEDNGISLCISCHADAHEHPLEFKEWFLQRHPERWRNVQAAMRKEQR